MDQNKLSLLFDSCKIVSKALSKRNTKSVPDFFRANGNCICLICGKEYSKHPFDYEFLADESLGSYPFLHILCDGTRVKL